jgi:hypothetical protein
MNQPQDDRPADLPAHVAQFPYVNGGLFRDDLPVPEIRGKGRRMMIECGQLAWEAVNPDIFGSMFQAVVDEESRDALGQHYTSVPNIMKVIRPLFLDKLYAELHKSRGSRKRLEALLERLTRIRVFDPAMGSGNFLIISYKELRRLEMAVFRALQEVSGQQEMFMSGIRLSQFYGIEIDDFAHEVAQLSLWLAEHQMNTLFASEFGRQEPVLPLKDSANLVLGNSLRVSWESVCSPSEDCDVYVCGNPPFNGYNSRSSGQRDDMAYVFQGFKKHKDLDFVSCWLWLGAKFSSENGVNVAFVSTNSIFQGEQVSLLWPKIFELGVSIDFAYQAFSWGNSAKGNAGVHVVVVGMTPHKPQNLLYQKFEGQWNFRVVKGISPYLLEGGEVAVASRAKPISASKKMVRGNQPTDGGHFFMTSEEREEALAFYPEISNWIKKVLGGDEFLKGRDRWVLWLSDASDEELGELLKNDFVRERLEKVSASRLRSSNAQTRKLSEKPHLFWQDNQPRSGGYILFPRVTSERRVYIPIGLFSHEVIVTDLVQIVPGGDPFDFSILSSSMHVDWLRLVGGRLESRLRYSAAIVYNTFPWPDASERQRQEIEKLGREVILARAAHPDKTMAQLYDPDKMPENLLEAHQALDRAVEKLYRDRPFRDTAERQEYLLARYEQLIEAEKAAKVGGKKKTRKATTTEG